jgi:hypothetical protein
MAILTRAEIDKYPGSTATERELAHEYERAPKRLGLGERSVPRLPRDRAPIPESPLAMLPARLDLRPFPGRDRKDRIAAWLIAHVPRASGWSRESIADLADRIAATRELIE